MIKKLDPLNESLAPESDGENDDGKRFAAEKDERVMHVSLEVPDGVKLVLVINGVVFDF
jgi:hypothetical protein